ncbi:MAG: hypothetical protein BroJett011_62000 [Chloroflexota bacterium]|nr:MAG: hypothetical protein BroJett011_62000 [Chloroflexota bacterium]
MAAVAATFGPAGHRVIVGKRGRTKTVEARTAPARPEPIINRSDYTPEYWQAVQEYAFVRNTLAKYDESQLSAGDRRTLTEARAHVEEEKEISDVARKHGYVPGRMSPRDWSALADELKSQAHDELRYARQMDRDAAGDKLRGKADTWMQVGGEARLVRSGASAREARAVTQSYNQSTRASAAVYMREQLVKYGYSPETVEKLDYQQRRRLLSEIGWGAPQSNRISGVSLAERERVISSTADRDRMTARAIAVNPRAGQGLETWTYYEQATIKAGQEPGYLPDLGENDAPDYVLKPDQGQRAKIEQQRQARADEIEF